MTGAKIPADRTIDGIDQTDLLFGKSETGRKDFYFERAGVRLGKWKYLTAKAMFRGYAREDGRKEVEELYDLEADIGEKTNLAEKNPEKLAELRKHFETIKNSK